MSISAYGYTWNCKRARLPFKESILSMLPIMDEVVIVDGYSDDDTYEILKEIPNIKLYSKRYDKDEPRIDILMKMAALEKCKTDLVWCLDLDEVIHEKDVDEWLELIEYFNNSSKDLLVMPMIDFWGRDRLQLRHKIQGVYRNNGKIIQGVIKDERWVNSITGRICSRASHGGEFINPNTLEYLTPTMNIEWHPDEYFLAEYEREKRENYEQRVNEYCRNHAVIYHYSWYHPMRKFIQRCFVQNPQDNLLFGRINYWSERWEPYGGSIPTIEQLLGNMKAQMEDIMDVTIEHAIEHPAVMQEWLRQDLDGMYTEFVNYDKSYENYNGEIYNF
jgi:glycosyltransferase involved in cell wall biosynthesis